MISLCDGYLFRNTMCAGLGQKKNIYIVKVNVKVQRKKFFLLNIVGEQMRIPLEITQRNAERVGNQEYSRKRRPMSSGVWVFGGCVFHDMEGERQYKQFAKRQPFDPTLDILLR